MIVKTRNAIMGSLYRYVLKPLLFQFDPEYIHRLFISIGVGLGANPVTRFLTSGMFNYSNPALKQDILGIEFRNPVGLSAGFDKNAELTNIISKVGFGFEEVGSITAKQCSGNSGVRLKRLPEKKSLWVNFGLNNAGADKISKRLEGRHFEVPLGVSIAKTNCKETVDPEVAIEDYVYSIQKMQNIARFFVINISCPNAFGGQPFTDPRLFERLMHAVYKLNIKKPILVKMSPDIKQETMDKIIESAGKYKVSGFICTNLTKDHDFPSGGLSGKVVEEKSNRMIEYIYKKTKGKFVIIGVGGIFSAEDAYRKIKLGASLVELISGMIYNGPQVISEINRGLVSLLKKDGFDNIRQAVGKDIV